MSTTTTTTKKKKKTKTKTREAKSLNFFRETKPLSLKKLLGPKINQHPANEEPADDDSCMNHQSQPAVISSRDAHSSLERSTHVVLDIPNARTESHDSEQCVSGFITNCSYVQGVPEHPRYEDVRIQVLGAFLRQLPPGKCKLPPKVDEKGTNRIPNQLTRNQLIELYNCELFVHFYREWIISEFKAPLTHPPYIRSIIIPYASSRLSEQEIEERWGEIMQLLLDELANLSCGTGHSDETPKRAPSQAKQSRKSTAHKRLRSRSRTGPTPSRRDQTAKRSCRDPSDDPWIDHSLTSNSIAYLTSSPLCRKRHKSNDAQSKLDYFINHKEFLKKNIKVPKIEEFLIQALRNFWKENSDCCTLPSEVNKKKNDKIPSHLNELEREALFSNKDFECRYHRWIDDGFRASPEKLPHVWNIIPWAVTQLEEKTVIERWSAVKTVLLSGY